ncbi:hypothetical protein EES41_20025 [Streptomyces sp. ADI95-16]|nr:hypothetical protein EES41_20025 [Streptomyces sp. ADI95-16]
MTWLNDCMEIGECWAYRAKPKELGGALRQVEIVRVGASGRSGIHVRFLEGDEAGLQEWVSAGSLLVLWADADAFRADDTAELALAEASREVRGSAEFEAARMILGLVRPKERLRLRKAVADAGVLELGHLDDTAPLVGMEPADLRGDAMVFEDRNGRCLAGWLAGWLAGRSSSGSRGRWPSGWQRRSCRRWTADSRLWTRNAPGPPGSRTTAGTTASWTGRRVPCARSGSGAGARRPSATTSSSPYAPRCCDSVNWSSRP